jgi:hypothetical protein
MWRAHEYRHLADSTRRRGYVEQNALRAQWEILAWEISDATYRVDVAADILRESARRAVTRGEGFSRERRKPSCL